MGTQRFVAGPLSVLCILALVLGTASAAVITATDGTSNPDAGPVRHHLSPEALIDSLEEQGVDVSEVKADLQNGDTEAVKAWLENYFQTHGPAMPEGAGRSPPDLTDPIQQEKVIARLEEEGVDVSEVRTLLQNGDTTAVKAWLEDKLQAHRPEIAGPGHPPPDLSDSTRQEKCIARLEEEGVDVSEVRTLLQNGDTEAVRAWLKAHKPEIPAGSARSPPDLIDATRQERIITRLEQQGVDVTEVKSGLQNGDTTAVKAWLENYVHSHEGEMPFRNHPGETPSLGRTGTSQ